MLGSDRMETENTEATSNRRRNDIEKSMWKTHQYFVDFENQVHVEIPTSNRYHNFHVVSPFKIDKILTNFPRGISTSNRWQIDKDVSIWVGIFSSRPFSNDLIFSDYILVDIQLKTFLLLSNIWELSIGARTRKLW